MWKAFGIVGIVAIVIFGLMQLARPQRHNEHIHPADTIEARTGMPPDVSRILNRACRDCHTELTTWYWYSAFAPNLWLMVADVNEGRARMDLSEWGWYPPSVQLDRLHGMCNWIQSGRMPLWYYKPMHYPGAWLSNAEKNRLCEWTKAEAARVAAAR